MAGEIVWTEKAVDELEEIIHYWHQRNQSTAYGRRIQKVLRQNLKLISYHRIPEQYEYDESRTAELKKYGLKLFRFSNEEVLNDIEGNVMNIRWEINKFDQE